MAVVWPVGDGGVLNGAKHLKGEERGWKKCFENVLRIELFSLGRSSVRKIEWCMVSEGVAVKAVAGVCESVSGFTSNFTY